MADLKIFELMALADFIKHGGDPVGIAEVEGRLGVTHAPSRPE